MIKSFKVGDVLSESSHYKVLADNGNLNFKLKHLESGDMVYRRENHTWRVWGWKGSEYMCVFYYYRKNVWEGSRLNLLLFSFL